MCPAHYRICHCHSLLLLLLLPLLFRFTTNTLLLGKGEGEAAAAVVAGFVAGRWRPELNSLDSENVTMARVVGELVGEDVGAPGDLVGV